MVYKYGAVTRIGPQVFVWSSIAWLGGDPCYTVRCALTGNWTENPFVNDPRLTPRGIDGLEFA